MIIKLNFVNIKESVLLKRKTKEEKKERKKKKEKVLKSMGKNSSYMPVTLIKNPIAYFILKNCNKCTWKYMQATIYKVVFLTSEKNLWINIAFE